MIKTKSKMKGLSEIPSARRRVGIAVLSVFLLSACDTSLPPLFGGGGSKRPVMVTEEEMKNGVSRAEPVAPAPAPAVTAAPLPADYMNSRSNKNLFGSSIRSDDERLNRLERAVQDLRNDFDTVQPSIRRLMAIESDIQELIGELRVLSEQPTPMVQKPAPVAKSTVIQPATKVKAKPSSYRTKSAPPVQDGKATVFDVRSGEHPGKTRLVLDTNTKTSYNVDIDNGENIMVIDMPNTMWTAPTSKSFPKSSVISSYNVEKSDAGALMIIQLKKNASLTYNKSLPSNSGAGQRIVLDISPQ